MGPTTILDTRWRCSQLLNLTVTLNSPPFLYLSVFVFPMYLSLCLSFLSLLWLPCISQSCDIARHRQITYSFSSKIQQDASRGEGGEEYPPFVSVTPIINVFKYSLSMFDWLETSTNIHEWEILTEIHVTLWNLGKTSKDDGKNAQKHDWPFQLIKF